MYFCCDESRLAGPPALVRTYQRTTQVCLLCQKTRASYEETFGRLDEGQHGFVKDRTEGQYFSLKLIVPKLMGS
mgnify:CR=1 FL=1